jgi:hypothetical protein
MTTATVESWGALAEPIHDDATEEGHPTWKDNAYLAFWDIGARVFGSVHVSTSPNAAKSRRARCSFSIDGKAVDYSTTHVIPELAAPRQLGMREVRSGHFHDQPGCPCDHLPEIDTSPPATSPETG